MERTSAPALLTEAPTTGATHVPIAARARQATKSYGLDSSSVTALDHVDVDIRGGELTAVMGPSGSGKSTLMHCLAGLDTLTSGQVFLGDTDLGALSERALTNLRRDRIGFIFQAFNLVPTLTAAENITLPLDLAGRRADRAWFDHVIEVTALADRLTHRPSELSGGQQQRVAVARALVGRPEIIFADEPTGNLDSRRGSAILELLRHAVDTDRQTIVMVTHDPVAASFADSVSFLADGRIVDELFAPTPERILDHMKSLGG